jgi:putative tributyrin esterase
MALLSVNFFGNSIGFATSMNVLVPDSGEGPFPVFYLLHGLSDDHSIWLRRTSIERYVAGLPMIVVMPTTHRGFYTNGQAPGTYRYEDHLVKDVVGFVDRVFPTIKKREGRVIGGLSMGGYGAVKLALKYPEVFCAATAHSGAMFGPMLSPIKKKGEVNYDPEFAAMFGKEYLGGDDDLIALAKKCAKKYPEGKRPALRIDCGREDFLIEHNRAFVAELKKQKFAHEYAEFAGAHNWEYWDLHVREAIAFHRGRLGI